MRRGQFDDAPDAAGPQMKMDDDQRHDCPEVSNHGREQVNGLSAIRKMGLSLVVAVDAFRRSRGCACAPPHTRLEPSLGRENEDRRKARKAVGCAGISGGPSRYHETGIRVATKHPGLIIQMGPNLGICHHSRLHHQPNLNRHRSVCRVTDRQVLPRSNPFLAGDVIGCIVVLTDINGVGY